MDATEAAAPEESSSATCVVKFKVNEDLRRFTISNKASWAELEKELSERSGIPVGHFIVSYQDDENDMVRMSSDAEVAEQLTFHKSVLLNVARIAPSPPLNAAATPVASPALRSHESLTSSTISDPSQQQQQQQQTEEDVAATGSNASTRISSLATSALPAEAVATFHHDLLGSSLVAPPAAVSAQTVSESTVSLPELDNENLRQRVSFAFSASPSALSTPSEEKSSSSSSLSNVSAPSIASVAANESLPSLTTKHEPPASTPAPAADTGDASPTEPSPSLNIPALAADAAVAAIAISANAAEAVVRTGLDMMEKISDSLANVVQNNPDLFEQTSRMTEELFQRLLAEAGKLREKFSAVRQDWMERQREEFEVRRAQYQHIRNQYREARERRAAEEAAASAKQAQEDEAVRHQEAERQRHVEETARQRQAEEAARQRQAEEAAAERARQAAEAAATAERARQLAEAAEIAARKAQDDAFAAQERAQREAAERRQQQEEEAARLQEREQLRALAAHREHLEQLAQQQRLADARFAENQRRAEEHAARMAAEQQHQQQLAAASPYAEQLRTLAQIGFNDVARNTTLLQNNGGNVEVVADLLISGVNL